MGDRGSVLFLYVAGVLVVVVLGAIAADLSHVYMARRDLIEVAGTIANDTATAGVDQDRFRTHEDYRLDPDRTSRLAQSALDASTTGPVTPQLTPVSAGQVAERNLTLVDGTDRPVDTCDPTIGACRVRVSLYARVEYIFGRSLPGNRGVDLHVTSYATLEEGP
jgi:hypothetical protein